MKRILSLILALILVVGMLPVQANADTLDNGLVYNVYGDHVEITDYTGDATEIVIPGEIEGLPVTSIGPFAFFSCTSLTSISLPDSVTSIGHNAFQKCTRLTSITLPDSVTSIGIGIFQACSRLTSINISDGITTLPHSTFYECSSLTKISIPASVTYIDYSVFAYCDRLKSITFEGSAPEFDDFAFDSVTATVYYNQDDASWKTATMQDYDGSINWQGTSHPHKCTSVVTDPSCTGQGYTTYTCDTCGISYRNDYISALGHDCADGLCIRCNAAVDGFQYEIYEDHLEITGYTGQDEELVIPGRINGLPVTRIANRAFSQDHQTNADPVSVIIPLGVTAIGDEAFRSCDKLVRVDIPDTVTHIGEYAFYHCHNLTSAMLPEDLTTIGQYAFYGCFRLPRIFVFDKVTSIGDHAFSACEYTKGIHVSSQNPYYSSDSRGVLFDKQKTQLIQAPGALRETGSLYTVPEGVTSIGDSAFAYCADMYRIYLSDGVTSIGNSAFNGCVNLVSVEIPDSVTFIGENAFYDCWNIREITIPEGVTSISDYTFKNCTQLGSVSIPNSVTSIGACAFESCTILRSIELPDSVTSIGSGAFKSCTRLSSIMIPDSVASIGSSAFSGCSALTEVELPEALKSISPDTFLSCSSLVSITIPEKVTSIDRYAFRSCASLKSVFFTGDAPWFTDDPFMYTTTTAFYPSNNPTWTEDVMQDYGGDITWVPYDNVHTHAYTAAVTDPTCTEQGFSTYTCLCGDSYVGDYVDALGHDYADGLCIRCDFIEGLQYELYWNHVEITGYTGSATELVIPARIEGLPVTVISSLTSPEDDLSGSRNLTSIVLPASITALDDRVFSGYSSLAAIYFEGDAPLFGNERNPDSGEFVFYGVTGTAFYPGSNPTWTENVMQDYSGKITWVAYDPDHPHECETVITAPTCTRKGFTTHTCPCGYEKVTAHVDALGHDYADNICKRCDLVNGLRYTVYPDHVQITRYSGSNKEIVVPALIEGLPVTSIGQSAFQERFDMTSIVIPDSVTSIGDYAFYNCTGLSSFTISDSVDSIGKYAFYNCFSLTGIVIPDGVTSINHYAFQSCTLLTSVFIPASVTSIGDRVFDSCSNLEAIYVDEHNPNYSNDERGVLFDKEKTVLIKAPNTMADPYTVPDSVASIGDYAFRGCVSLPRLSIPGSVTSIGNSAFEYCRSLAPVVFHGDAPQFGPYAFIYLTITACYPSDNPTWTEDVLQGYGGKITWIAHDPSHEYTAVVTAPTCTERGYTTYTCACGESYVDDYVDALGHSYTAVVTNPTCTGQGFTTYTCLCGDSYTTDPVEALGHDMSQWEPQTAPTCTEDGTESRSCFRCDCMESRTVDALGHDYTDGICGTCGEADPDYEAPVEPPFTDVPAGAYYEAPVLWAVENGITAGATENSFNPGGACLRAHVVTFLWRAAKQPEPAISTSAFTDVKPTDFFFKPVLWAVENGITSGVSATEFGSYANCNRAAVVTFLWRAAGSPEPQTNRNPFTDVKTTDFFYKPVLWAVENGITAGLTATTFGPTAECNRAQVVTFLYRAYN